MRPGASPERLISCQIDVLRSANYVPYDMGLDNLLNIEISRYMEIDKALSALSNPVRRNILSWLKDRGNFPPPLPEHADLDGVCVGYIQEKAGLSQSTISTYMNHLKDVGFVLSERHGQWTFYRRNEAAIESFVRKIDREL